MKKKNKKKFFNKVKLGTGLLAGGVLGMLFAPKKGRELRGYFNSSEFKGKIKNAKTKAEEAKDYMHDKAMSLKERFMRLWTSVRKRFGM